MGALVRPGLVGRSVRLGIAALMGFYAWVLVTDFRPMLVGDIPVTVLGFWIMATVVLGLTAWVANELAGASWGWRPTWVLLAGAGVAAAVGAWTHGSPWAAPLGAYLWVWAMLFVVLLGVAHVLAAALGTPGCEMRSYRHLWTLLRGGDAEAVACPGWIDRFDSVRVAGRW